MSKDPLSIARNIFQTLRKEFPGLCMEVNESPKFTDLELTIPTQPGINHEINLNLQNTDELHFNVDEFWGEWFPCTDPKVEKSYIKAICGFISGQYRIEVYSRKGKSYKRLLQSPSNQGWSTEYTHTSIHWPCLKPQIRYVQNGVAT